MRYVKAVRHVQADYGLARTRFMGLAKNITLYGLAAIVENLRKGVKFLTLYGLRDSASTG